MRLNPEYKHTCTSYGCRPKGRCWAVYRFDSYEAELPGGYRDLFLQDTKAGEYLTEEEARREVCRLNRQIKDGGHGTNSRRIIKNDGV